MFSSLSTKTHIHVLFSTQNINKSILFYNLQQMDHLYSPLPSSLGLSWLGVGLPSYSQRAVAPVWEERRRVRGCARWSPGLKDWEIPPLPLPRAQPCREPSLRRPVRRLALGCSSSAWDATLLSRLGETGALMGSSWTEGRNIEECYFVKQKFDIFILLLLWINLTKLKINFFFYL